MRRLGLLVEVIRRWSENEQVGTSDGISQLEVVQAINDGQERLVEQIHMANNKLFMKEVEITPVLNQEAYDLPFDIFTDSHVVDVIWSKTGNARDYFPLEKTIIKERFQEPGDPTKYILRRKQILLNKIPNTASAKGLINYNPRLPKLDIRRGQVSAVTLGASSITSLTLDNAWTLPLADAEFDQTDYITVVNRDGDIQMKSIPIDSVNTTSGVVTVTAGFNFEAGETIAVGDYVCLGDYATTHSELPELTEKYLIAYGIWKLFKRDSSNDSVEQSQELIGMERNIIDAIGTAHSDVDYIPLINENEFTSGLL